VQLTFRHDLAFVTATLTYSGISAQISDVLVDAGGILGMDFLRAASTVIDLGKLSPDFA